MTDTMPAPALPTPTPPRSDRGSPRIAVAFGGGGARGLAHLHVIRGLNELGLRPVAIAGASIGAIMGAGMAAGMSADAIEDHILTALGRRGEVANRLWSLRPATMRDAMSNGFRLGQFNLERVLKSFLPPEIPEEFAGLSVPLMVSTTDYYGQAERVLDSGPLYPALAASAALPALFMPVRLDGRVLIDGGIFNPVPYEQLRPLADIVIGIDVVGAPEGDGSHVPNRMDSLFGASQLMMQANIALKLRLSPPDIFLRPAVNRFRVLDFLKARQVLDASASIKDELKTAVDAALEAHRRG